MIVVDSSVVVTALGDDGDEGARYRARVESEPVVVPELLDLEAASAWRRLARSGVITNQRAIDAIERLADMPLVRTAHRALLPRVWELRDNVNPYDAAYIALAEWLDAPLVTADARLARAPGIDCEVELLR